MDILRNQLYIEGENNNLFIYFHLKNFSIVKASEVLDKYVEAFKDRDFDNINISFCNKGVAGEHLSTFRKTSNQAIGKILKGIKFMDACFNFKDNLKVINKPKQIC